MKGRLNEGGTLQEASGLFIPSPRFHCIFNLTSFI